MNNICPLQDAKSKLSEVVERALAEGAQIVTWGDKKPCWCGRLKSKKS